MFWLLRMLVTANWSEKKNPRQHAESVAFPFNIKTHKLFIFNSLFIFPALLCKPESTCVCLYTHFKPHDLPESPDEAKWKWVQQSYDWSRRNQPHYNHSTTFFFFHVFSVKEQSGLGYVPTPNQLPPQTPDPLSDAKSTLISVFRVWSKDVIFF